MSEIYLTCDQSRAIDEIAIREFAIPGVVLMENAGRNCAELLLGLGITGRVVICCGKGNNGGDGFVVARHLLNAGVDVAIWLAAAVHEITGDAAINWRIVEQMAIPVQHATAPADWVLAGEALAQADWIVDALLGTGAIGNPREPLATAILTINSANRPVLSIDLPSGLNADTGQLGQPCVKATHTATFVAAKIGFREPAAQTVLGQLHIIDIGIPKQVIRQASLRE